MTVTQGRNFGVKSGGTDSEGERGALGFRDDRGGEWGGSVPLLIGLWGLGERHELSQWGPRRSSGRNGFTVTYFPQIASVDSR